MIIDEYINIDEKEVHSDEDFEMILKVIIRGATGISTSRSLQNWKRTLYYVFAWIEPDNLRNTPPAYGCPDPCWNHGFKIPFVQPLRSASLKLEVVRTGVLEDVGTSTGLTVVGRARVPLPTQPIRLFLDLVKSEGSHNHLRGTINVELELIVERKTMPRRFLTLPQQPRTKRLSRREKKPWEV